MMEARNNCIRMTALFVLGAPSIEVVIYEELPIIRRVIMAIFELVENVIRWRRGIR